jgi:hypothetical protein
MIKRLLLSAALASAAFSATWDVAGNFNAANNPGASNDFSNGWINGGVFTPMSVITPNCFFGNPTDCLTNGGGFPGAAAIEWNGTGSTVGSGTVNVFSGYVSLDPQGTGGSDIRFTAPFTDVYSILGNFRGADSGQHPTTGEIFLNNALLQTYSITSFSSPLIPINLPGLSLNVGDIIDFRVITASDASFLSTGLEATITSQTDGSAPEPGAMALMLSGAGLLIVLRKRCAGQA